MFTNYFALCSGGVAAVSAYAVMSYAIYTFDYIFQGVCDGIQPIISYCWGASDNAREKSTLKCAAAILIAFSLIFMATTPLLIKYIPVIFAVSGSAKEITRTGFIIYMFSYPFKAIVKFVSSYYYACGKNRFSNILVYADPLLLTPIFLFVFSDIWGINGVWLAMPAAQGVLTVISIISMKGNNILKKSIKTEVT